MANIRGSHKSGFITRGGRSVRETVWLAGVCTRSTTAAATAVLLTSLNAAALALRPFTVVRTRGLIGFKSDQLAGTEPQAGAYGECVVSDQAAAIGVTAVPTPVTDDGSDLWYVYQRFFGEFAFTTAAGFENQAMIQYPIDSKAMRKVEDGQDLITVLETETTACSQGVVFMSYSRFLIKLH